jgi:hypothetical protein
MLWSSNERPKPRLCNSAARLLLHFAGIEESHELDTDVEMFDREVVLDALFRTLADHHAFAMTPSRAITRPERPLAPFRFRRI